MVKRFARVMLIIIILLVTFFISNDFNIRDIRLSSDESKQTNLVDMGDNSKSEEDDTPKQEPEIVFADNSCVAGFEQCGTLCCEIGTCSSLGGKSICKPESQNDCTSPNTKLCTAKDLNMCCYPTNKCGVQIIGPFFDRKEVATCLPEDVDACKPGESSCGNFKEKLCCPEGSSCIAVNAPGKDIYFCEFDEKSCTEKGLQSCKGSGNTWGNVVRCCNQGGCRVSNGGMPYCTDIQFPEDQIKQT